MATYTSAEAAKLLRIRNLYARSTPMLKCKRTITFELLLVVCYNPADAREQPGNVKTSGQKGKR